MFKALAKKAAAGVAGGEPLPEAGAAAEPVPAVPKYMADLESEDPMMRLQAELARLKAESTEANRLLREENDRLVSELAAAKQAGYALPPPRHAAGELKGVNGMNKAIWAFG
eukprot:gene10958-14932_t